MLDALGSHNFILWFQKMGNPFWDAFFLNVTRLGDMAFFALAFPYLFWCWNPREALKLMTLFLVSAVFVYSLKEFFSLSRPDPAIVKTYRLMVDPMESFPSGHAAGAAIFWGYLAFYVKKSWMYLLSTAMITLISFSRIYLGVHFLRDVLAGAALGLTLLAIYSILEKMVEKFSRQGLWSVFWIVSAGTMASIHRENRVLECLGILMGIRAGALIEGRFVGYKPGAAGLPAVLRYAGGLAGIFVFTKIIGLFPESRGLFFNFFAAAFGGFYMALLYPWFIAEFFRTAS